MPTPKKPTRYTKGGVPWHTKNGNPWTEEEIIDLVDKCHKKLMTDKSIVTMHRLYTSCGVYTPQVIELAARWPVLEMAHELFKAELEARITEGALTRQYDGGFSKFLLSARYGMKETQATEVNMAPITISFETVEDDDYEP